MLRKKLSELPDWRDLACLALAAFGFAAAGPATTIALKSSSILTIVAARTLIAAGLLLLIVRQTVWQLWKKLPPRGRRLLWGAGALLAVHLALYVAGVRYATYVSAMTLICLEPVVVVIFGFLFFKLAPTRGQILGVALALAGTLIISFGGMHGTVNEIGLTKRPLLGNILIILAALLYGFYYCINRHLARYQEHSRLEKGERYRSFSYAAMIYLACGLTAIVMQGLASLFNWSPWQTPNQAGISAILLLALLPTFLGHTFAQIISRNLHPAWAALLAPAETVGSILLGMLLFGTQPTTQEGWGGLVVLAGALLVAFSPESSKSRRG